MHFVAGKVNRDNHLDLILGLTSNHFTSFSISVLLGKGDGTFETAGTTSIGQSPREMALADVNLDGVPDITVSDGFQLQELLGNGDGTFRVQKSFNIGPYHTFAGFGNLVVTDFNGDGKPDLVLNDFNSDTGQGYCGGETPSVFVLQGYGDGTFNLVGKYYDAGNGGAGLLLADLNGDGRTDLAVLNGLSSTVAIMPRIRDGIATSPSAKYAIGYGYPVIFLAGDVNGDGREDLLVISSLGMQVLLNRGAGNFSAPGAADVASETFEIQATDFNRDGFTDLSIVGPIQSSTCKDPYSPGGVFVALGSPKGLGSARYLGYQDTNFFDQFPQAPLSLGDFNKDGSVDIALSSTVLFNNGNAQFTIPSSAPVALSGFGHTPANYTTAAGDFNGDGRSDLATVGASLEIRIGNGDGTFKAPVSYSLGGTDANAVLVKDVNGDGNLDLISVNYGSSTVSVFLGNGDGTFRPASQFAVTPNPTVIAAGDFNRDRKVDLAVASATTVSILLGDGAGGFSRGHDVPVGQGVDGIVAVDLRGKGISDLVLADQLSNVAILLPGKGDGTFAAPIPFATGSQPVSLATGDFNGDGAPDVAMALWGATAIPVFYNQGGTHIALASSNKTPKAGQSVTFPATVAASLPGNSTPTGTVVFKNGTTTLGTATLGGGKTTLTSSALAKGSHTITAAYSGNIKFNPHTSSGLTETVQ